MTCSKRILLISYICAIALTLTVVFGTFTGYDMGNVTTVTALAWGEVAVSNAFYFKKAAQENVLKISKELDDKGKIEPSEILNNISNQ